MKIGVVTSDTELQQLLASEIEASGYEVVSSDDLPSLLASKLELVFAQWPMNERLPNFLAGLKAASDTGSPPVIALVPHGTTALMMRARAAGAADVLFYPPDTDEIRAEIAELDSGSNGRDIIFQGRFREVRRDFLLGEAPIFRSCMEDLKLVAKSDANVLLLGDTGTGKEVFARAIHLISRRAGNPFKAFNCTSIPSALLEAELFGTVKGAFTGATDREGRFELAGAGTLLLDEIGDMELSLQAKLLRVIEARVFSRLGENKELAFNARLICATGVNLKQAAKEGKFRRDLLGRIDQFRISLPTLRERSEDIPILARYFLRKHAKGRSIELSKTALEMLESYEFPNNVRELENVIVSALARSDQRRLILPKHLPKELLTQQPSNSGQSSFTIAVPQKLAYKEARAYAMRAVDRAYLNELLRKHNGTHTRAAEEAGVDRKTFSERIEQASKDGEDSEGG